MRATTAQLYPGRDTCEFDQGHVTTNQPITEHCDWLILGQIQMYPVRETIAQLLSAHRLCFFVFAI